MTRTAQDFTVTPEELRLFASGDFVRSQSRRLYDLALAGKTSFEVHPERLDRATDRLQTLVQRDYPRGGIPFHSRWVHFQAGGLDRLAKLEALLSSKTPAEKARAKLDLATVSVLLDAGAGPLWSYSEEGRTYSRSEGLAVASFHAFLKGRYASNPGSHPLQVDAERLCTLTARDLAEDFQVRDSNPLVGLETRAALLNRLGQALQGKRPGFLWDAWVKHVEEEKKPLRGNDILRSVLLAFSGAWEARVRVNGLGFGDAWSHPLLSGTRSLSSLIPFHKLSQWLSYSLMEPIQEAGLPFENPDDLTGLPEYRNGGLFLDLEILVPREPGALAKAYRPEDLFLIEWRALTVALLDELAPRVRQRLGVTATEFPLVKLLQAGTWQAGREVAAEKRPGGAPPLNIESDGTVF